MTRRRRNPRGIYRRVHHAIYPGGSWRGYTDATITLVLECGHRREHRALVWGASVSVPPIGVWCRPCLHDAREVERHERALQGTERSAHDGTGP